MPCTAYLGPNGAGHYVKMVHNGIEYIDMQLICEAYRLMKKLLGMKADEMSEGLRQVERGRPATRYLIQITADILQQPDPDAASAASWSMYVLDTAGQKGTGKWTGVNALDMGIPANAIAEAVFARCLSAHQGRARCTPAKQLKGPGGKFTGDRDQNSSTPSAMRCTARRSAPTPRASSSWREAQKEYNWKLEFRDHRQHLARRVHHPRPLPAEDHRRLHAQRPSLVNLHARPLLQRAAA